MEMGTDERIGIIEHEGEIYTCPVCGYTDGWHVSFKFAKGGSLSDLPHLSQPLPHRLVGTDERGGKIE